MLSKLKDLTGQTLGYLFVEYRLPNYIQPNNGRNRVRWQCKCLRCGNKYVADGSHLLHGDIISCGCLKNDKAAERMHSIKGKEKKNNRTKDLTGQKFGKLMVIEKSKSINGKIAWLCECECGNKVIVRANHLLRNLIKSCGCTISFGEEYIRKYLNKNNINYSTQYTFNDLKSTKGNLLKFDFALLDSNNNLIGLIEYQGEQHLLSSENYFGKQQREETDDLKYEYCQIHNIPLYYIWFYDNIEYMLNLILTYCKLTPCQASKEEGVTTISQESTCLV